MPSQFHAVAEVFDNYQIQNPSAKTPLINFHETRVGGILARFGQRTCDTADAIEDGLGTAIQQGEKAVHCMKEAVEDVAESLLSAALQAGEEVAAKFAKMMQSGSGKLEDWKNELEQWARETFGDEYAAMKKFYDDKIKPKVKAASDWLQEKKTEANDMLIESLEHLQAGYNAVLDKVDALAYGAGDMAGVMRKTVCGLSGQVAAMTRHGLEGLGYKHKENVQVCLTNLRNDTRCLRTASVMNNVQASIVTAIPPAPMPADIPGAAVANNINSHMQRAQVEVQVAANRFAKSHCMKLEASVQAQAASIIHAGVPGAEGGTPVMPQVTPEKEVLMQAQVSVMVSTSTRMPVSVYQEMTDTWIIPPKKHYEKPIHDKRTLTPTGAGQVPASQAGAPPAATAEPSAGPKPQPLPAPKQEKRDPVEQPQKTAEEVAKKAPETSAPKGGLPAMPELDYEEGSDKAPKLNGSESTGFLPEVLYEDKAK